MLPLRQQPAYSRVSVPIRLVFDPQRVDDIARDPDH
jgi:hypothetical protein